MSESEKSQDSEVQENNVEDVVVNTDIKLEHLLRRAREKAGFDLEGLARKTCLNEIIIKRLEDDVTQIEHPMFLRAYLRAYTREVGLEYEAVLAHFETITPQQKHNLHKPLPSRDPAGKNQFRRRVLFHVMTGIVVLSLIIASFVWWRVKVNDQGTINPFMQQMDKDILKKSLIDPLAGKTIIPTFPIKQLELSQLSRKKQRKT